MAFSVENRRHMALIRALRGTAHHAAARALLHELCDDQSRRVYEYGHKLSLLNNLDYEESRT